MLLLIEGKFNSGTKDELLSRIRKNIDEGKRSVLIVPEQQTVIAEWEYAEKCPPSAPLYFEVSNFTRFANTSFRALGGIQKAYADNTKKALIMWQALTELSPILDMSSGRREVSAGLTERSLSAVKEAESLGLDSQALRLAAENEALGARLSSKLSDLSKISALYKAKLHERYADTEDDSLMLIKKLEENKDYLSDTEIFIDGFTSFTVPQYALISELLSHTGVTVCLDIPKADSSAFEYSELLKTRAKLTSICDKRGVNKKILKFDGSRSVKSEALISLCPLLWKSNLKIEDFRLEHPEEIRIFEAKNPFEECEFVASDIRRRVMNGESFRDFAIVVGNSQDYNGILDTGLDKAEIVHFSSVKTSLMSFEAVKLIFAALSASHGYSRSDILAYASSGLCGISSEERDEFEMYTDKWQINGSRFVDGLIWNMNPLGFENRKAPDHDEILARINSTRVKLLTPLMSLSDKLSSAKTVRDFAASLFSLTEEIKLEEALIMRAERLASIGETGAAEDNLKLYSVICKALDTMVEAIGESKTDRESFTAQLKIVFSSSEIGRIPSAYDEVMIGGAEMLRTRGKKHIYLLGVNYGKFPAPSVGSSYFTDRDREMLAAAGLDTDGGAEIRTARSLYSFTRAFASATETITVSYCRQDSSFGALNPSFVIENIVHLTNGAVKVKKLSDVPPRDKFYSPDIARESLGECSLGEREILKNALIKSGSLRIFDEGEKIDNGELTLTKEGGDCVLYLTQTAIDSFLSCPLKYFCQFTLSLSGSERAKFGANNIGSFIHAVLENFFSEVRRRDISLSDISEEEKADMTRRAARIYLDEFEEELSSDSARTKSALSKIYRAAKPVVDGLCEEFKKSKFTPVFFELPITKIGGRGPTPVEISGDGGEKIYIYGTIDRVDTFERDGKLYVRVVDYKTGAKSFSPEEIENGENLQMFLYLKSIIECENEDFKKSLGVPEAERALPAGLVYVKTDINDQKIDTPLDSLAEEAVKKAQKRMGMVLADREIFDAMGEEYLPVKLTKSGVHKSYEKFLFTPEGWEEISKSVERAVSKIGHRIASGEIRSASGKEAKAKEPCKYCKFKAFCRNLKL